ncbi:MAG: hypothetical protein MK098_03625 [Marinovum sp.]|nr:hypothetical protein [Marinovum sp.]
MSIAHLLEDFGPGAQTNIASPASSFRSVAADPDTAESIRLEAYEDGYKAGWDDAVGANTAEQMQVAADLAQNLRDMSFTYQEASAHISQSLHGVFDTMMDLFLPQIAKLALAPKVSEMLEGLPVGAEDMQVVLSVAPESQPVLKRLVEKSNHLDLQIEIDASLTGGQVVIGFADTEMSLDFDALLQDMRNALETYTRDTGKETAHG